MSDIIIERAEKALRWMDAPDFHTFSELVAELKAARKMFKLAQSELLALNKAYGGLHTENERLKSYKSLPEGMVWQDYYSPDDVIKIRAEVETRILNDCCRGDYVCGERPGV